MSEQSQLVTDVNELHAELAASRLLLADAADALKPFAKMAKELRLDLLPANELFESHLPVRDFLLTLEILRRLEAAEKL